MVTNEGMRHRPIHVPITLLPLLLGPSLGCDLGSRVVGSDDDGLPSGETYETRVHFDVEYAEGYPIGVALADDLSFVVMLHGSAPGDDFHGTHFLHHDADGNLLEARWDPTPAQTYDLKSAGDAWLYLSRDGSFQSDEPPGDEHANVTLTELSAQGVFSTRAVYPCHLDHCRMSYEPASDSAWTVTEVEGGVAYRVPKIVLFEQ